MLRGTENANYGSANLRADALAANFASSMQNRPHGAEHESRPMQSSTRRERASYYVFRQGILQIQAFDRQTIGW
jgi:hypothetical protein